MKDFLLFNTFITQDILIIIYYLGVLFLPIFLWVYRTYILTIISKKDFISKIYLIIFILILELFWRMMFEAMIGYFDIHNYLEILSTQT